MPPAFNRTWNVTRYRNWERCLVPLAGTRPLTCMEIGVWEAQSAVWLLEHVLTGPMDRYLGIDTWAGGPKYDRACQRAMANLEPYANKSQLFKGDIFAASGKLHVWLPFQSVSIVIIDGDHSRWGCSFDTAATWPLLEKGGIMIWDDYDDRSRHGDVNNVREVVDEFLRRITGQYKRLFRNFQLGIRKV